MHFVNDVHLFSEEMRLEYKIKCCYLCLHVFDCYEYLARNAGAERRNAYASLHVKCPLTTVICRQS